MPERPWCLICLLAAGPLAAQQPSSVVTPSPAPPTRFATAMVSTGDRLVLFAGMSDSGTAFADTWEWDGGQWQLRPTAFAPSPRGYLSAAYDQTNKLVLIYGGGTFSDAFADTWVWDGANWMIRDSSGPPAHRRNAAMAYDSARGRAVMFGGDAGAWETWEWDGAHWMKAVPVGPRPPARCCHDMVYDAARRLVVLFGGVGDSDKVLGDTWEWNGTEWAQRAPTLSPPPRSGHAMAFDAARKRVVLFGGRGADGKTLDDTWEWNGSTWEERVTPGSPGPREGHVMAYDGARRHVIMFGGFGASQNRNETWGWDGVRWWRLHPGTHQDWSAVYVASKRFALRRELTRLMIAQQAYYAAHRHYADSLHLVGMPENGPYNSLVMQISDASDSGWAVDASDMMLARAHCVLRIGKAPPLAAAVTRPGEITCLDR